MVGKSMALANQYVNVGESVKVYTENGEVLENVLMRGESGGTR